jgi:RNA polymerase sigma-70 factor (ECF subfamily)
LVQARAADRERTDVEDGEVVAAYLETRDPELFRLLVERHQGRVLRLVASILGPFADMDAQEVTQEVFLRMHERLSSFRGEARFSSWLYRLAYNRTLEYRRRARLRLPHVPAETLAEREAGRGPFEEAAERERRARVEALLDGLPDVYRSVVYLHYWLDASVEEIAETMVVPAGTVKSYLSRARARLRRRAQGLGIEGLA